ncbi:ShlB/FhaC/HecB family hemolysin secretion/activation protein [uncultured Pseudacidovorax sp.]|uniref:ShlB/FhaC/HecB family hemolysin secretion/activation protein n=1 Tax=uncultured Pseudacidovorax sp. TaxID=679313 RepID=UPI0025FAC384|nr:ShlB/FhaC/HecB family hemolysin secretion/activation protein [uncultured Pseudacidovorax sp.]
MSHSFSAAPSATLSRVGRAVLVTLAAAAALPALAQPVAPPDAGQVLRELRPPIDVPPRGSATLTVPADTDTSADIGQRFLVRRIRVDGVRELNAAEVHALVAPLEGTQASLGALRQGAQRITQFYRQHGYIVARAFVPAQQVADGVVTITVLESELTAFGFDNRSQVRTDVLAGFVEAQGLVGKPIVADAMDRTLLLLSDLPGVGNVSGNLKPGARVGTSDLVVEAEPGKRVDGDLSLDNHGNRYTGQNRANARVTFNSLTGIGDRLDLRGTASDQDLLSGRIAYDLPLGRNGLRGGVALSTTRYELGREFANLDASGTANTASAYASWPLLRGLNQNVWLAGSVEARNLRDRVGLTSSQTDKKARAGTLEAYGDLADALGGGGYSTWRVAATAGRLDIDTPAAAAFDAAGPRAAGGYSKLQLGASRLQALPAGFTFAVQASGQMARKNLDSSEKFVVGGAYGVRAYPQGEGVGDDGWLLNLELRHDVVPGVQAMVFYDAGGARFSHDPYAAGRNHQTLRGYGVGLQGQWKDFYARTSIAWRDGDAPLTAPDRRPRVWLAGGWRF